MRGLQPRRVPRGLCPLLMRRPGATPSPWTPFLPPKVFITCWQLHPGDERPHEEEGGHGPHATAFPREMCAVPGGCWHLNSWGEDGGGKQAGGCRRLCLFPLCFPEAFCTRHEWDDAVAQKAGTALHNCPVRLHLGPGGKTRGIGPGGVCLLLHRHTAPGEAFMGTLPCSLLGGLLGRGKDPPAQGVCTPAPGKAAFCGCSWATGSCSTSHQRANVPLTLCNASRSPSSGSLLQAEPRAVLEAGAGDVLGERHPPPATHTAPGHPVILQTQPGAAPGFATGQGKDTEKQEHHPSVPCGPRHRPVPRSPGALRASHRALPHSDVPYRVSTCPGNWPLTHG